MKILELFSKETETDYELEIEDIFDEVMDNICEMRDDDCNKGTFGTLACICGSYGMAGAALLCGSAAVTCGAGIVKMLVPESIYQIAASNLWENVFVPLKQSTDGTIASTEIDQIINIANSSSAVVLGCGIKVTPDTEAVVCAVTEKCTKPIILDADGINCISKHIDVLSKRIYPTILTPHPGEMSRLTGLSVGEIQSNREKIAADFAQEYGCTLVLKGVGTVITNGKRLLKNTSGNGCLAKGGSGDVLAGIIGALVCQCPDIFSACAAGVYLHGFAADHCIEEYSSPCVTARDVINAIKYLM